MILGIGTDILLIQRIRDIAGSNGDSFFKKTYTVKERDQASSRPDPLLYYATRFAGKEAVFKSIGLDGVEIRLDDIEILGNDYGRPQVELLGKLKSIASDKGIKNILISLSYDTDYAVAFAIAQD